ncbi:membrane-bound serine protease (ClpP class) [Luteibacter rhizovicinus]|uniref:Membrane-bound serine protease (ClpP class) n=1 Tax=Luteibacter rhizovicinus TaxID=242606 RepID=A0A4R3YX05_9GAMM|nr:nodulation protein NfeD [Luteibacter rhizovicinus]TCV96358.1 membrane-bound serine protease (ClpP class) [Luteibacter rhizovicinus]
MSRVLWLICVVAIGISLVAFASESPGPVRTNAGFVARIELTGPIGPATEEYVHGALRHAAEDGATAVVLQMDTPGGLAESMDGIVADILASKLPVLGYVAPGGARAASAGTYILYACPIAAMAPATHLGAATPVSLGGRSPMPAPAQNPLAPAKSASTPAQHEPAPDAESQKVLNDAIASIRSLAQLHGRNAAWAERAVRGAATLTASEAADQHVIDFVAADVASLLAQADGHSVKAGGQTITLKLRGLPVSDYLPDWRERFLAIITNPTIAYVLLMVGIYGLILEAFHPGAFLPGVVGGICLLIGLYALQLLPVNYAGLALMALGLALLLTEVFVPMAGVLGVGGVVAFVLGSIMLFRTGVPGYAVNLGVIAGIASSAIVLLALLLRLVMRARRAHVFNGDEQMLRATGELLQAVMAGGESWARIGGESWRVHSEAALPAGTRVRVTSRQGLLLQVIPVPAREGELS